ncbi:MAG: Dyp-type peroxidase, partial [Chromatiales bacterium]|nr:Dyp-type peroxidase [Chromatiales bacterium]
YAAAVIAAGQKGEGGRIAFTQRWVHDLPAFGARSVTEQERIIGRTKPDSIELEGDAMPADSHVAKTDLSEDGVALKIYRRSAPYGSVGEHGLHFVCFATTQRRIQLQLESMFGLSADGEHDRIIEYSTPVTGSYWFVPSTQMLTAALASL